MNQRCLLVAAAACLLVLFGCAQSTLPEGHIPPLLVEGDVDLALRIDRASAEQYHWSTVEKDGQRLPCLPLSGLVDAAGPWPSDGRRIYLVGGDGLMAEINGGDLEGCHIAFSQEFGWESVTQNHPISTRIKQLDRIVVESLNGDSGLRIISSDHNSAGFITPSSLLTGWAQRIVELEGSSEIGGHAVTVHTTHLRQPVDLESRSDLCFVLRDGSMRTLRGGEDLYWQAAGNRIDLVTPDETLRDVACVVDNAPLARITDVYGDTLHLLNQGHRVLILELDGWGYKMAEHAGVSGGHPYLSSLPLQKALACAPTISPTGLASMLTGLTPDRHGITSRDVRELAGEDLFQAAAALGKACAYVEGDSALIATSTAPLLSPDLGGIPGTDDEVYAHAAQALTDSPDLAFVHFHGIDDVATETGPFSAQTLEKMRQVDGYVQALIERWQGKVIVTSDHGLRELPEGGGTHGGLSAEELLVPYCIVDGGVVP